MKQPTVPHPSDPAAAKPRGFTLVEVMMAAAVGGLVLASVASILVMSLRLVNKNSQIDSAVTNTRVVQEHLNGEMAVAISQTTPKARPIRPEFADASPTTPIRYAQMTYRVPIGSFGTIQSDTGSGSDTITMVCPADVAPKVGDYFLMDAPDLGRGIPIRTVSTGTGTVTVTLASTLAAGTTGDAMDAYAGKLAHIQRERKYETIEPTPSTNPVTELRWYETVQETQYVTLSRNVDSHARYLFARVPDDAAALEPSVGWQFTYVSTGSNTHSQGGDATFYQSNFAEGLIMPKSGDPLSATSYLGGGPTTLQSTTTLGTTTLGTSTSQSSTTTLGTSTSQSSTTTLGTSTSQSSTTTLGTSTSQTTTAGTSTSQSSTTTMGTSTSQTTTTTLGTSTSQSTTTLGTSTSRTTTAGTSTSRTTTTLGTTTMGTSTSRTTTTLGTTTMGTSTSRTTTTLGTTTMGTSTSRTTTTLGTSTMGTSTSRTTTLGTSSSRSTTTLGTSTSQSTTTMGTSTSRTTTTTLGTSTSQSTTTLGTSTSRTTTTLGTSTSQTTTLGTSTSRTTTTLGTTTSQTTTLGTSTSQTTTLGTTTSQTTTQGTSTSRSTSTSKTTTTIPFDG